MTFTIKEKILQSAKIGIDSLKDIIMQENFCKAFEIIKKIEGKVIFTGIGKSGYIAGKIAATMSSFGRSSIFLHPSDASHGDLGLIKKDDLVFVLSKSGENIELESIVKFAQENKVPVICMTMCENSFLAKESDVSIILKDGLDNFLDINAPMTSTTMMLVLGDCLSGEIAFDSNIDKEKYKKFHPGGRLGKNMTKIKYIMRAKDRIPIVNLDEKMPNIIIEITNKMLGLCGVIDQKKIVGVITDGDLRRSLDQNLMQKKAFEIMTRKFKYLTENTFLDQAIEFLTSNNIVSSIVVDENMNPIGATNIHDLLNY